MQHPLLINGYRLSGLQCATLFPRGNAAQYDWAHQIPANISAQYLLGLLFIDIFAFYFVLPVSVIYFVFLSFYLHFLYLLLQKE